MNDLLTALYGVRAIQLGTFELKRDFFSPFQVDFASILSVPELAKAICKALWEKGRNLEFDLICGVPTIGSAFAGFISWEYEFPMVMQRLDGKEGMQILGKYKSGQRCLVLQDTLSFGHDLLHFVDTLEEEGLKVIDTLCFIDLQVGGKKRLKSRHITPHAVIGMQQVIEILYDAGKIGGDQAKLATDFLENAPK